jgi:putative sigma-54 modulation protein
MFVREQGSTFEEATDLAVESLKMQVKKFKSKRTQIRPKTGLPDALAQREDEELED